MSAVGVQGRFWNVCCQPAQAAQQERSLAAENAQNSLSFGFDNLIKIDIYQIFLQYFMTTKRDMTATI